VWICIVLYKVSNALLVVANTNAYDTIPSWTLVALQPVYLVHLSVFASRRISTVACVANIISDDDRVVGIIVWFHVIVDVSCSAEVFNLWSADPRWSAVSFQGVRGQHQKKMGKRRILTKQKYRPYQCCRYRLQRT